MQRIKQALQTRKQHKVKKQDAQAKRVVLEELFYDIYNDRKRIYKVNFIRGLVFGVGSAIGGTVVVALIVWVFSLFVNAPFIGQMFENAQNSVQQTTSKASRD